MKIHGWQCCFFVTCLLMGGQVAAADWQLKASHDGVQIYQQHQHPQFRQRHTLGLVRVQAGPAAVLALLKDLSACPEWVYGCLSAHRLPDGLIHMVFDGPLWFKDRDLVFSTQLTYLKDTNQWLLVTSNQPHKHPGENPGIRRLQHFSASWLLTPVTADSTHVSYELYMDPEMSIKAGVNKYNRESTYLTLLAMRQKVTEAAYQQFRELPWEMIQSSKSDND